MSYRVAFFRGETELVAWALNLSRGGLRAVVEDRVLLGEEVQVRIDEIHVTRRGRVVWTQDEPDGTIVGISFFERIEEPGVELDGSADIAPGELARQLGMTEAELQAALDDTDPVGPLPKPKPAGHDGGPRSAPKPTAERPRDGGSEPPGSP